MNICQIVISQIEDCDIEQGQKRELDDKLLL